MKAISIHMMTTDYLREHFLLWRCLHDGPLNRDTIDAWRSGNIPWAALRKRNIPLLQKLTEVYGACAVVALDKEQVVGQLRFYPKNIWQMSGGGMLCLQQFPPDGPEDEFAAHSFPPLEQLVDKTLVVHCLMTGCPNLPVNPYQRKGIGTRMVHKLIEWAGQSGWEAIEATAYAELEVIYRVTGQTGKRFWEKVGTAYQEGPFGGLKLVEIGVEEGFYQTGDLLRAMQAEAIAKGINLSAVTQKYTMRLDIKP
jgi:hypothetical protein